MWGIKIPLYIGAGPKSGVNETILFLVWAETFVFLLGLGIGSFLNVVIIRGAAGEGMGGRSRCCSCRTSLGFKDLIPVFSFCARKGRCRHCGAVFSKQYPVVELATGFLFAALFYLTVLYSGTQDIWKLFYQTAGGLVGISSAIVIFVSDLKYKIIPNGAVLILLGLGIILSIARIGNEPSVVWAILPSAFLPALFMALLWLASRGKWMGLGDAKLIFTTSLILGYPAAIPAFLFSFWLGGLAGMALIFCGRQTLKSYIPFGPFILLGSALAYFFSSKIFIFTGFGQFL